MQYHFEGCIPSKGKLSVGGNHDFLGFVEVNYQPKVPVGSSPESPHGLGTNPAFYFRDYIIHPDGSHEFIALNPDPNTVFQFNIAFLRVPPDLDYVLVKKNDKDYVPHKMLSVGRRYAGLALFNIAEPRQNILANACFIQPNMHLKTSPPASLDTPVGIETNAAMGCSTLVSFGNDKVPIFSKTRGDGGRDYYLFGMITDNTPCYFKTNDWQNINEALKKVTQFVSAGKSPGFAHHIAPEYWVPGFNQKYGIHQIDREKNGEKPGWELDFWDTIEYT